MSFFMNLTEKEINKFNSFYDDACKKMEGLIILEGYTPKSPNFFEKRKIKKSIDIFKKALEIVPEHFPSLFFIGKLYQRLGKYEDSLSYFEKALIYEHNNHTLPQEASLVAMHLNNTEKALEYSLEAVRRKPDNIGVLGNHSMNLLIFGKDEEALLFIDKALSIDPSDKINIRIKKKIEDVISRNAIRPTFKDSIG